MAVVNEDKTDDIGHDDESEETTVDSEDHMAKETKLFFIKLLCWKRVCDQEGQRLLFNGG